MPKDWSDICYQKNKERLQKKVCARYQDLSEEEKNKKQHDSFKRYKNLSEDEKVRIAEYRKKIL